MYLTTYLLCMVRAYAPAHSLYIPHPLPAVVKDILPLYKDTGHINDGFDLGVEYFEVSYDM